MKRGCASVAIIVIATLVGVAGGLFATDVYRSFAQRWRSIGPRNVHVADLQAFRASLPDYPSFVLYVVLARTADGRVLSTDIIAGGPVEEWRWTDVSGGRVWTDFPQVGWSRPADQGYELRVWDGGNVYRVDAGGQWQPASASDRHSPFEKVADADASMLVQQHVDPPPGGAIRLQYIRLGVEGNSYLFALARGREVLLSTLGVGLGACIVPVLVGALGGLCAGLWWAFRRG